MEVIILAGGLGTRLRSVVADVPKCMAPVGGKPFLWYLLKYLTKYPISRVILSVGYLREVIFDWIKGHQQEFPFEFDYAIEEEPLGTGGGIKLALSKASDPYVVILNGDTFFDVELDVLCQLHDRNKKDITLALKLMRDFNRYGTVSLDTMHGTIVSFNEKQYCDEGLINGGVYVINRNAPVFEGLPDRFSFETAVLEPQCAVQNLQGIVQDGYFIDIGIPEDFEKANYEFPNLF